MADDIIETLKDIEKEIRNRPSARRLSEICDDLENPAFLSALEAYLATTNDPDNLQQLRALLSRLARFCELQAGNRLHYRDVFQTAGVGGGSAAVAAALIGVSAPFAPIAILGGAVIIASSAYGAGKLRAEAIVLGQLQPILDGYLEKTKQRLIQ